MKFLILCMTLLSVSCIKLNINEALFTRFPPKEQEYLETMKDKSVTQDPRDRAMALDVGGKMYEAMKLMNKTSLTKAEFVGIVKGWFKEHNRIWNDDVEQGFEDVFDHIDTDNSTTVNKKEIFHWLFKYMDTNGDGVWNSEELKAYMVAMAKHTGRVLNKDWEKKIDESIARIDDGVTAEELEKVLSEEGKDITSLKEVVKEMSKPKEQVEREKLDKYDMIEWVLASFDNDTKLMDIRHFMHVVRDFVQTHNHTWNASHLAFFTSVFQNISGHHNNKTHLSKKDITDWVFSFFDKNGDKELTNDEISQMFEHYAAAMNRTMNDGWWQEVEKAIHEIEAGVSPDELWKYLAKDNKRITDIRQMVIDLSDPEENNEEDDKQEEHEALQMLSTIVESDVDFDKRALFDTHL